MAQAPQAAMEMPQEPSPFANPDTAAVYDQMRQTLSPKEFGDEMLAGASQVAPEDVAAFKAALEQVEMPPEALELLNNMVDEILAAPEKYDEIRAKYKEMGAPDEILPEQFDPNFFAALNMAVDQMIAAPAGVQAFARGGIAELSPVSKAIAGYGRNGDTMLAHITPAEARMLRRKGGSGTINPKTGLPEYFNLFKSIGKAFKAVGNAVKSFVNSTVGRVITTVALGFFLGPAAASMLGVSSAAGVAAVSGFVGSAGSTLLGGGNIRDALKAGAVGGLTAGAGAGIMGGTEAFASGSYSGAGLTPSQAIQSQWDKATSMFSPAAPSSVAPIAPEAPVPGGTAAPAAPSVAAPSVTPPPTPTTSVAPPVDLAGQPPAAPAANVPTEIPNPYDPSTATRAADYGWKPTSQAPSFMDQAKDFYNKNISPSGIQQNASGDAISAVQKTFPTATAEQIMSAPPGSALAKAYSAAMPGMIGTYGPATAVGIGTVAALGGFSPKPLTPATTDPQMMKSAEQRIAEEGKQRNYYVQNLPGVKYDQYGAPIFGQYVPLPTYSPPGYAAGGSITPIGAALTAEEQAAADKAAADKAAADAAQARTDAENAAARQAVIDAKNNRLAQGSGEMYKNINAGLNVFAPTTNREAILNERQRAFAPVMLKNAQFNSGIESLMANPIVQPGISNPNQPYNTPSPYNTLVPDTRYTPPADLASQTANQKAAFYNTLRDKGMTDAEIRYQVQKDKGMQSDQDWNYLKSLSSSIQNVPFNPNMTAQDKAGLYNSLLGKGFSDADVRRQAEMVYGKQSDQNWNYLQNLAKDPMSWPITTMPVTIPAKLMNMGGIAALAQGGYPRRTGQISGPGTETSDSIPAMLSDGEFVMTAKAVRGAGKGDRRAGAKRMYALMNQLERNASRG